MWMPPPDLRISEWADRHRRLSAESSAEPGSWSTDRAPYQRGIMDAVCDPSIHTIVVMSAAQVGKTEIINNIVGYYVHQDPAPILLLQPTLEMAQAWSKDRLAPMLRDTPALRGRVKDPRTRDSGNTMLHKVFPGGHITMAGSNSPASLASRPIRIILCDEVDRYPLSAGTEGDPVNLAKKRSATFWNRKLILTSTPTIKGISRIESAFEESDKRHFHVPCPHCGVMDSLKWSQIHFEDHDASTTFWACSECGGTASDGDKLRMLKAGKWIAETECNGVAGFHLNELYSPWRSWAEVVGDFLQARAAQKRGNVELMQVWVNTSLGETWEEQGESIDSSILFRRREHYPAEVPDGVQVLTAYVDTQDDRLEYEVCGWGAGEESWSIDYRRLYGDPSKQQLWDNLAAQLRRQYKRENGTLIDIKIVGIDSGGHFTDEVYKFSLKHGTRWIIPTKGSSQRNQPIVSFPRKPNAKKLYLTSIGPDTAKELVYRRYEISDPGPGYCHYPIAEAYDEQYFAQATAEKKLKKYHMGVPYFVWDAEKRRNEALDCRVGNLAMIRLLQAHFGVHLIDETAGEVVPIIARIQSKPPINGGFSRRTF